MDDDLVFTVLPFVVIVVLGAGSWLAIRAHPRARGWRPRRRGGSMDPRTNGHSRRGPKV